MAWTQATYFYKFWDYHVWRLSYILWNEMRNYEYLKDIHVWNFNSNHIACKLMPEWTCFPLYLEKGGGKRKLHMASLVTSQVSEFWGRNWQPHYLKDQTGNNFWCILKNKMLHSMRSINFLTKAVKIVLLPPCPLFICNFHSNFLNAPTWF